MVLRVPDLNCKKIVKKNQTIFLYLQPRNQLTLLIHKPYNNQTYLIGLNYNILKFSIIRVGSV